MIAPQKDRCDLFPCSVCCWFPLRNPSEYHKPGTYSIRRDVPRRGIGFRIFHRIFGCIIFLETRKDGCFTMGSSLLDAFPELIRGGG